jgi:acyl-CoA synthetase (AMP-forming)/AMP-acid ligase II
MTPLTGSLDPRLSAPGARYEIVEEDVLGERMPVFKHRLPSLRALVASSSEQGDAEYVIFGPRRITYADHARGVASVAAALRDRFAITPGDRVAILAANCPEWIVAFWATVSLGAVVVGLNGWWAGDEIRYGLADSEPALLIADRRRLERLDGDAAVKAVEIESGFDDLWSHDPTAELPTAAIDEDDPALILYTSGTSGRPKGVVHSHRNVLALVAVNTYNTARKPRAANDSTPRQKILVTNPLFHVSGLHNGAVALLSQGATIVLYAGRFDPETVMATLERERCTSWPIVATTAWRLVNHPRVGEFDLSSVTHVGGGASPISAALQQRLREVFPRVESRLGVGYGLTECGSLATIAGGPDLIAHPDSVGRPVPTVAIEIRDEHGVAVTDGIEGEVHVRSPLVMPGYWRNDEATAQALLPGRWLRTGDLGWIDDGMLYLSARRDDLILRGGENVSPAEIETCLEAHPSVRECAVIGVPHAELGQEVLAVVVAADPAAALDVDALRDYLAARLAAYKVPAHWEVRTEPLPRNATGKVLRNVLMGRAISSFIEE